MYTCVIYCLLCMSSSALYAARREEKHRYSPGGVPSHPHPADLQVSSAAEGTLQMLHGCHEAVFRKSAWFGKSTSCADRRKLISITNIRNLTTCIQSVCVDKQHLWCYFKAKVFPTYNVSDCIGSEFGTLIAAKGRRCFMALSEARMYFFPMFFLKCMLKTSFS